MFYCCYLNTKNGLLAAVEQSRGSLDQSVADVRLAMKDAIRWNAAAMILVHNHPSGDPTPSGADIALTERFNAAGEILNIPVLDHVIIGAGKFVSLRREHLFRPSV